MNIIQSTLKEIGYAPKTERIGGNACVTEVLERIDYLPTIAQAEDLWCKLLTMFTLESEDWSELIDYCMRAPAVPRMDTAEREILTDSLYRLLTGFPHSPGYEVPEHLRKLSNHILIAKLDGLGISTTKNEE